MRISNLGSECGIFYLNSGSFAGWRRSVSDLFSRKLLRRDAVQTTDKTFAAFAPCFALLCRWFHFQIRELCVSVTLDSELSLCLSSGYLLLSIVSFYTLGLGSWAATACCQDAERSYVTLGMPEPKEVKDPKEPKS